MADLKVVTGKKDGDTLVSLTELKRLKNKRRNQRRREKLKLMSAMLKAGQLKERKSGWFLSQYIAFVSVVLFALSEWGIGFTAGYMQNGNDLPFLLSAVNAWLPSIRNSGVIFAQLSLPRLARQGRWQALIAIPLSGYLLYWSFLNFHWFQEMTSINATRAKEISLEDKLLQRPDIALKKESYEEARKDKQRKETDAISLCNQNDGSKCIKARQEAAKADLRYQQRQQEYNTAMAEAKATAIKETSPMSNTRLNWMNAILPLTAGVLLSLL